MSDFTMAGPSVSGFWRGDDLVRAVFGAAQGAIEEVGEDVFNEALMRVPRDTEQLAESGKLEPLGGGEVGVRIVFGDDELRFGKTVPSSQYAIDQHENMTYRHPRGGGPKYLEGPTLELGPERMMDKLGDALSGVMR